MVDAFARFGIWFAGLPTAALTATGFVVMVGGIFYGASLWMQLRRGEAIVLSERARQGIVAYLLVMTACMTLFLLSSIAASFAPNAVEVLPKERQDVLLFGLKAAPLVWYVICGGIVHQLWRQHRAQA